MATERITAPAVKKIIGDHLNKHTDVYDILINKHEKTLYGPDGDDGLCFDVREIVNGFKTIKNLGYAVILAIVLDLLARIMSLPK